MSSLKKTESQTFPLMNFKIFSAPISCHEDPSRSFESEGYVEVVKGLMEGEEVVIEGNFLLDAQAQLFGGYE